jgi:hypothetical protein
LSRRRNDPAADLRSASRSSLSADGFVIGPASRRAGQFEEVTACRADGGDSMAPTGVAQRPTDIGGSIGTCQGQWNCSGVAAIREPPCDGSLAGVEHARIDLFSSEMLGKSSGDPGFCNAAVCSAYQNNHRIPG